MSTPRFGRMITAMVTPFTPDLDLDLSRAQELALKLLNEGSDALVVCGTTGESPTVFYPQKLDLFRAVIEAVDGRAPISPTGSRLVRKQEQCQGRGFSAVDRKSFTDLIL